MITGAQDEMEGGSDASRGVATLQERVDAFRASDKFDMVMNPIIAQLDKTLKRKGVGGQRWSDSSEDPETSLFGFARMPSIIDAVEGKSTSELRVELEERAEAVVISVC
jgi:hypothetical protein